MRIELPQDYVPPQPTHPTYGYMTPEELEAFEAQERERLGLVPVVEEPGTEATEEAAALESSAPASPWAQRPARSRPATGMLASTQRRAELVAPDEQEEPAWELGAPRRRAEGVGLDGEGEPSAVDVARAEVETVEAAEPEQVLEAARVEAEPPGSSVAAARAQPGGWVPGPPPEVPAPVEVQPAKPASVLGQVADFTWDAYRQEWVSKPRPASSRAARALRADDVADRQVPIAAAAGGRGASGWRTGTDGERYRWDAATGTWVIERPRRDERPQRTP